MASQTIQEAAVVQIATFSTVTSLLGSETDGTPWIFQNTPQVTVEGSGKSAVIVRQEGSWTPPNFHNTIEFPRLVIDALSAPSLNILDVIAARDAEERNLVILAAIRAQFHRVDGSSQIWDGVRVLDCVALLEPAPIPLDIESGELKLHRVTYALKVG